MKKQCKKKALSLDELVELARLQEEKELREKQIRTRVEAARSQKEAVDARQKVQKIGVGQFYKEMQEVRAFGVTLQTGVNHDIEVIEL